MNKGERDKEKIEMAKMLAFCETTLHRNAIVLINVRNAIFVSVEFERAVEEICELKDMLTKGRKKYGAGRQSQRKTSAL